MCPSATNDTPGVFQSLRGRFVANFSSDRRKIFNAGISLTLWLAGFLLFALQRQVDSTAVAENWTLLRTTASRQVAMLAHGADMPYVRRDVARTIEQFCSISSSGYPEIDIWIAKNITNSLARSSPETISERLGDMKPLLYSFLEVKQPSFARSSSVLAWCVCALVYLLVELLIYGFFSVPAQYVEASLSVLHVGFVGTALEIAGGLVSHFSWIWLIFFALHALLVVGQGLGTSETHALARHAPYLVAIPFSLFWATFDGSWAGTFWSNLTIAVFIVYLFLLTGILYARRPQSVEALVTT